MSRNKSKRKRKTSNWANKQERDPFVKKARSDGYRARAVFKLEQIDQKAKLIRSGTRLVDLGAAPGSWTQYAVTRVADPGQVIAVDLLPMEPVSGVAFVQGDFTSPEVVAHILEALGERELDLVLSDMAPNISGIRATDQARAENLQESILAFCQGALRPGGALLTKLFEGEAAVMMRKRMKLQFDQFQAIKPEASRAESKEIFLLARGYRRNSELEIGTDSAEGAN